MYLLRALLMPLQAASLLFLFAVAVFYLVCTALLGEVPFMWLLPGSFVGFWIAKYGYELLGQAANGTPRAPVPSIETFGPFDGPGPLAQLLIGLLLYQVARWLGSPAGSLLLGVALAFLPASIGVLGATHHPLDALNPRIVWRMVRGLGAYYALVLAFVGIYVALAFLANRLDPPEVVALVASGLGILSIFACIGAVIYERRIELGIEPRASPERAAARARDLRARERQRVLDEVYAPLRAREYARAVAPLTAFLDAGADTELAIDVPAIMAQAVQWNDQRGLATVSRCVISSLLRTGELALALGVADEACSRLVRFALESEPETVALSRYAKGVGRSRLALLLLERLVSMRPECPLGTEAAALRSELER
jgi:hypothetical protein